MYQIKCDDYILYDPRDDDLIVQNPKCKLEVNTVGEASFTIFASHPYYDKLKKMRSVFEILQDGEPIFRGRMTDDSNDFNNTKGVDLEGVMAYFNDSVIRPFAFPDDFSDNADYNVAAESGNVVEFFLSWLINQHNAQVQEFQRFKLGNVTVADPNNYLSRTNSGYASTWETLKSKLFDSAIGGYLCIRYEDDGNYIDYLADFEYTNIQRVEYGENLLDLVMDSDASTTYSAVIPLGKKRNEIDTASEDESRLTIEELDDGDITNDIVKNGDMLYSKSAVEKYGFICAPTSETTWEDVAIASNLRTNGVEYLSQKATMLLSTTTIKAVDLHFSDEEIEFFRIYRFIQVLSKPHNHEGIYRLTKLDIDIQNPQNTTITLGDTVLSLTDINRSDKESATQRIEIVYRQSKEQSVDIAEMQNMVSEQSSSIVSTCESIIFGALSSYVETSNYKAFKESVESQLKIMADEITLKFTETVRQIANIDGDLQEKFNTITKYFTFEINGMTIGQVDNPNKVVIDNDEISILVNEVAVQSFDAQGRALIPELNVTRSFNLFGYVIEEDENQNVNCEYVGG